MWLLRQMLELVLLLAQGLYKVAVGPAYASDVRGELLALAGARAQGHLLADAGFDAISLRQLGALKGAYGAHPPQGRGRAEGPEAAFRLRKIPFPSAPAYRVLTRFRIGSWPDSLGPPLLYVFLVRFNKVNKVT